jgi:TRAP-type C4-dicarboxylate transport system substrate-binding protein
MRALPTRRGACVAGALAFAVATAACTAMPSTANKAGGESRSITLTMGTADPEGRPATVQIREFASQVKQLSGGDLLIRPVFDAAADDPSPDGWDQAVARRVADGHIDLGLIPVRAWDTEGVTSLRALMTPFLIDSDALSNTVVSDEELSNQLLSGLPEAGVVGLALVPEDLRHVFDLTDTPMVWPSDFRGATIRVPNSATAYALFEHLGAKPDDSPLTFDGAQPSFEAADTSFWFALHAMTGGLGRQVTAGNLTPYAKINSVVVNSGRWDGLTDAQQDVLREAAVATREWAIRTNPTDAERAAKYCDKGGRVVLATSAALAEFRAATQPVLDDLRSDPLTAAAIDNIEQLASQTPPPPKVQPCAHHTDAGVPTTEEDVRPVGGTLPNGTYRVEFTDAYLKAHGLDGYEIKYNHGVVTFTLQDGHWSLEQVAPDITDHQKGNYQVKRHDLYWSWPPPEGGVTHLTWAVDGNGNLKLTDVDDPHGFFFDRELTRIE